MSGIAGEVKLTVAICTRNRGHLLKECLDSLLISCATVREPWEVLVVDNGSTDTTPVIVNGFRGMVGFRWAVEMRQGVSFARNAAVRLARGQMLAFLDDDLLVPPDYAATLLREFHLCQAAVMGGVMLPRWEGSRPWWLTSYCHGMLGLLESQQTVEGKGCPRIFCGNAVFDRQILLSLGKDPFNVRLGRSGRRLIGNEESFLIDQLWEKGARIGFSDKLIAYHRVPPNRLTIRYFLKWHFDWGVSDCRESIIRSNRRRMPRWVIGEMCRRLLDVPKYLILGRPKDSIVSLFRFTGRVGRVWEYVRTRSESPTTPETPSHLLISEQYLPTKGGHVVLLHELSKRLGRTVVLTGRGKGQSDCDTVEGVAIERINLSRNRFLRPESLLMYFRLLWHGKRMIRKIGPSVLLAARALPEGLVATTLGRSLRIPSVIFAHGEEISPFVAGDAKVLRRKWTTLLKGRMLWRAYRQADLIVANSCFTRELVCRGGINPARVQVIHPGTDPVRFSPAAPDPVLLDSLGLKGRKVILTVGRLTWRKGQDTVIKALPTIAQAVPNVVYLVAGRGPYESGLKDMARTLNVENQVRFLGEVDPETLPSLYHCCDLFIMPNRVSIRTQDLEGFGIVFLEANACGKPVIGGNSGGVPDAIENGKSGLLVDGTSVEQVSAAVIRMLREPELADEMGRYGRQRVCERFTWDHVASSLAESITTLMSHLDKPPAD